jgi:hypothetical protein
MAFSQIEFDQMRSYLGFPRLFISANPFFESAMKALQSVSDGGTYPDSTAENAVRIALVNIAAIDGYISSVASQTVNLAVFEIPVSLSNGATLKQDYRLALSTLRREGTNQIMKIAIRLGIHPIRPYFYADGIETDTSKYTNNPSFFGGSKRRV